jgi:hypothetical protein
LQNASQLVEERFDGPNDVVYDQNVVVQTRVFRIILLPRNQSSNHIVKQWKLVVLLLLLLHFDGWVHIFAR